MCYDVLLLLLCRTLLASGNKVPVILEDPLDMTVARNEPVTLNCKVNNIYCDETICVNVS